MRRVVVTGLSLITPLGNTAELTFQGLCSGTIGIKELVGDRFKEFDEFPIKVAGYLAEDYTYEALSKLSTQSAYQDSQLSAADPARLGLIFGTDKSSFKYFRSIYQKHNQNPKSFTSENFPLSISMSSPIPSICQDLNIKGYTTTISAGFATGQVAIIEAFKQIKLNQADVILAGSAEGAIDPAYMMGLYKSSYLARMESTEASKPFDLARDGIVYSSGAGCLVLEELGHALRRNAKIYAEVAAYSTLTETRSSEMQAAVAKCMDTAVRRAGIGKENVHVFNCDASGFKLFDEHEGKYVEDLEALVTSSKGNLGHLISASGSVQSGISCMILDRNTVPHVANLVIPSVENVMYVCKKPSTGDFIYTLSNSFSYDGGILSSILFKKLSKNDLKI